MKTVKSHTLFVVTLFAAGMLCLLFLFSVPVKAKAHKVVAKPAPAKSAVSRMDREYVAALAMANRFLYAWQAQDQENAIVMLTNAAKRGTSEDRLQAFFSPGIGVQQSYQISRGKKISSGRYSFPVGLFVSDSNKPTGLPSARYSQIVVVKTKDDWAVDKLP
jgi:hypothetical protein